MSRSVRLVMSTGDVYHVEGWASEVQKLIQAKRGTDELVALERTITPTGQYIYLDPNLVVSIRDS